EREGDFVLIRAEQVSAGDFVRKAGADLAIGQQILKRGDRLLPARLGLLASQGIESVSVGRRVRVAIVTTGDELAGPRKQPRVGEVFDSNGGMRDALASRIVPHVTMRSRSPDNFDTLCTTLRD